MAASSLLAAGMLIANAVVVGLVVLGALFGEDDEGDDQRVTELTAFDVCKEFVERQLKSPETAKSATSMRTTATSSSPASATGGTPSDQPSTRRTGSALSSDRGSRAPCVGRLGPISGSSRTWTSWTAAADVRWTCQDRQPMTAYGAHPGDTGQTNSQVRTPADARRTWVRPGHSS